MRKAVTGKASSNRAGEQHELFCFFVRCQKEQDCEKDFILGSQGAAFFCRYRPAHLSLFSSKSPRTLGPHSQGQPGPAPSSQHGEERIEVQVLPPLILITALGWMSCVRHQPPNQLLGQPSSSAAYLLPKLKASCDTRAERGRSLHEPLPPGCHHCDFPGAEGPGWSHRWVLLHPQPLLFQLLPAPGQKMLDPFPPARTGLALACGR